MDDAAETVFVMERELVRLRAFPCVVLDGSPICQAFLTYKIFFRIAPQESVLLRPSMCQCVVHNLCSLMER